MTDAKLRCTVKIVPLLPRHFRHHGRFASRCRGASAGRCGIKMLCIDATQAVADGPFDSKRCMPAASLRATRLHRTPAGVAQCPTGLGRSMSGAMPCESLLKNRHRASREVSSGSSSSHDQRSSRAFAPRRAASTQSDARQPHPPPTVVHSQPTELRRAITAMAARQGRHQVSAEADTMPVRFLLVYRASRLRKRCGEKMSQIVG
jgi:hypothetical protein